MKILNKTVTILHIIISTVTRHTGTIETPPSTRNYTIVFIIETIHIAHICYGISSQAYCEIKHTVHHLHKDKPTVANINSKANKTK